MAGPAESLEAIRALLGDLPERLAAVLTQSRSRSGDTEAGRGGSPSSAGGKSPREDTTGSGDKLGKAFHAIGGLPAVAASLVDKLELLGDAVGTASQELQEHRSNKRIKAYADEEDRKIREAPEEQPDPLASIPLAEPDPEDKTFKLMEEKQWDDGPRIPLAEPSFKDTYRLQGEADDGPQPKTSDEFKDDSPRIPLYESEKEKSLKAMPAFGPDEMPMASPEREEMGGGRVATSGAGSGGSESSAFGGDSGDSGAKLGDVATARELLGALTDLKQSVDSLKESVDESDGKGDADPGNKQHEAERGKSMWKQPASGEKPGPRRESQPPYRGKYRPAQKEDKGVLAKAGEVIAEVL